MGRFYLRQRTHSTDFLWPFFELILGKPLLYLQVVKIGFIGAGQINFGAFEGQKAEVSPLRNSSCAAFAIRSRSLKLLVMLPI